MTSLQLTRQICFYMKYIISFYTVYNLGQIGQSITFVKILHSRQFFLIPERHCHLGPHVTLSNQQTVSVYILELAFTTLTSASIKFLITI